MKYTKIIHVLILFLFVFQFTDLKAEVVKPTFVQSFSLAGEVRDPSDVDLSPDGTKIFFSEFRLGTTGTPQMRQYTLTTPFDISTLDLSSNVGFDLNGGADATDGQQGFSFNNDGTKVFGVDTSRRMNAHTLATPYDFSSVTRDADDGISWANYLSPVTAGGAIEMRDIEFNNDGTKMFFVDAWSDESIITYNLSTPYLPSSATLGPEFDLGDPNGRVIQDFEFDDDGTRMYLIESHTGVAATKFYVYKLSTPFDVSTATFAGSTPNFFDAEGGNSTPLGLGFSKDGMKLYQVTYSQTGTARNIVYEYDLSCPYGIVICEADSLTNAGAQVEFAKHVIQQNTSTVFKRFDWLRRNEGNNNLNSNNIKLNIYNPVLTSLKKQLKNSLNEKVYSQVSLEEKKNKKDKNGNWSYWSHGDISFGRKGDTATSKPNKIRISGLMFGADKKIDKNKFFGAAIRFGKSDIESISPNSIELDNESLTLNLYGTLPTSNSLNLNALLGVSLLRIDQLLAGEITGERNGKQVFTAFNLQSDDGYGNFNIRPIGRFEIGITQFSDYTDFGTSSTNSQDTYDELTFKTGNIAAGLKFDNFTNIKEGRLSRHGSLEYVQDLTSSIDYKFKNNADNILVTKTVDTHSVHNIKGNVGFEILFENGYTFGLNYERFQGLDYSSHQDSILFKFGHRREEDSEFAFDYKPLQNNNMELSYVKNINGFDFKVNSNYTLMNQIPDYGANLEVSAKF